MSHKSKIQSYHWGFKVIKSAHICVVQQIESVLGASDHLNLHKTRKEISEDGPNVSHKMIFTSLT